MAANAISGADVGFDEDRGGPRNKNNYLSFPVDGLVFKSTKAIFPWVEAGPHEAPGTRMLIASCYATSKRSSRKRRWQVTRPCVPAVARHKGKFAQDPLEIQGKNCAPL